MLKSQIRVYLLFYIIFITVFDTPVCMYNEPIIVMPHQPGGDIIDPGLCSIQ